MRLAVFAILLAATGCHRQSIARGFSVNQSIAQCQLKGTSDDPNSHGFPSLVNSDYMETCMRAAGYFFSRDALLCQSHSRHYLNDHENPFCYVRAEPNSN